jgi:beta-alanine degradation protein BauB
MKNKIVLAAIVMALAAAAGIAATKKTQSSVPEVYKVLFENERTRIIEYHTNSGKNICGLGMHSHPAHAFIMLTDAKLRVVTPDGKEEIINAKAGEAGWEAAGSHIAENISGKNASCYLIEFKDKDWKPSTGMTP